MATWKRLTEFDGLLMDVNLDNAAFMHPVGTNTHIYFVGANRKDSLSVEVKETLEQIHKAPVLAIPRAKTARK